MYYTSTRDKSIRISSAEAITKGISAEGGLFVPTEIPHITLDEIASVLSVTRRSIEKKIKELRDAGYIKREGSNKTGRWVILV